jgi:bifunctional oligoribonuclease and PAP phosphatase NrnA
MNYAIPVGLIDLIRQSKQVLLASHVNADGDAYGSLLGMTLILDALGKRPHAAMHDPVLEEFRFLPGAADIRSPRQVGADYDLVISLDASSLDRLGDVYHEGKLAGIPLAVIDHHITNTYFGTVNWVEPTCAATCQMVTYLADALGVTLAPELAECLLTGVITDTLCFRTSNTTPAVLAVAMHLQEAGANLAAIVQQTLNRMPYSTLRLWALVLPEVRLEDGVLWAAVRRDQLAAAGQPNDESRLNSTFATVIEADISAVFTEKIGKSAGSAVECSFRAKPGFNVGELALSFGGGGHPAASGCTIAGLLDEVVAIVVPALTETRRQQASQKAVRIS